MELTDGMIVLRPPTDGDGPEVVAAIRESLAELAPWMPWARAGYGLPDYAAFNNGGRDLGDHNFLIFDAADAKVADADPARRPQVLGTCGLNHLDAINRRVNLGYWLRSSATGHGVATRATRLLAWYGHHHLALQRLELVIAVANTASQAVADRVGAVAEGVQRGRLVLNDTLVDATMASLLPADTAGWQETHGLAVHGTSSPAAHPSGR